MEEKYLMHFRTKGSKNGQRLYQNEDGTWTAIGLARRRAEYEGAGRKIARGAAAVGTAAAAAGSIATAAAGAKSNDENFFKQGKDGKPSQYEKAVKESGNASDKALKMYKDLSAFDGDDAYELDNFSDAELKQMLDRMKLEKEVNHYLSEESNAAQKGKLHLDDVLSTVGTVASIAVSAATVYGLLKSSGVIKSKPKPREFTVKKKPFEGMTRKLDKNRMDLIKANRDKLGGGVWTRATVVKGKKK